MSRLQARLIRDAGRDLCVILVCDVSKIDILQGMIGGSFTSDIRTCSLAIGGPKGPEAWFLEAKCSTLRSLVDADEARKEELKARG